MSGGSIGRDLAGTENSRIYLSGGTVGEDIEIYVNSELTIEGTGFNYPYGTYGYRGFFLTGNLDNGDTISNQVYIVQSATMRLVPEPATLLLLGFGVVMVRRKR